MSIPKSIETYAKEHGLHFDTIKHPYTETALSNCAQAKCPEKQMAKIIVCEVDHANAMFVLPANERIHMPSLRSSVGAKTVKMLKEDQLRELFPDCEVGAQPAFGELYHMPIFLSSHFKNTDTIYFNGGTHTELLKVPFQEFLDCEHPMLLDFSVPSSEYALYQQDYTDIW